MSEPAFSKGPWHRAITGDRRLAIYGLSNREPICVFSQGEIDATNEFSNADANARLIAAAPDLHYVATLVTELAPILGEKNAVVRIAQDAIKKARGEP